MADPAGLGEAEERGGVKRPSSTIKAGFLALCLTLGLCVPAVAGTLDDWVPYYDDYGLFLPLAEQGDASAQFSLGVMYEFGWGVPKKDDAEAVMWYRKAADQGLAIAQSTLGRLSADGQDFAEAVKWYRKAADQGLAQAQNNLGVMYANGQGVLHNDAEAVKWYHNAAAQGNGEAQGNLGEMYANGRGVPQDYTEAVRWYRKAADQGLAEAQNNLGVMYANGQGVPQDYMAAYGWFRLAASFLQNYDKVGSDRAVKARDQMATHLTPAQIAKAQKWVRDWKPVRATPTTTPIVTPPKARTSDPAETTPTPKVRKIAPAVIQTPPVFTVPLALRTTTQSVEISGRVGGGTLAALTVEGKAAPFKADGSFNFRRAVPIGESDIRLVATNEWGQSAEAAIKVTRSIAAGTEVRFSPLDPSRRRGKSRPHAIALIIGIEQYKSAPPAEFAENDARSFYDYAINALGVPASRVKLLTGADAQRVDVEAAILTWLKPQVVKGQTEVFVFFSGHGLASDDGKDLYLLPQDGNRALLDRSALRRKELIDMIVDSGPKSATLFLDTCYSGGTRGKETLISSARPILVTAKEQTVPPNVTILAAAGNDQLSSSLAQAKHGLFSYFLMKGLEGEAAGSDRTITAAKLEAYLAEKIPVEAAKLGRTQTPQLIGDGSRMVSSW